jgi:hypothetical protein
MIVLAKIGGLECKLSVGEGNQSIKWLGGAILSYVTELNLASAAGLEGAVVTAMKNLRGDLMNPNDRISDHVEDDGCVRVIAEVFDRFFPINTGVDLMDS